MNGQSSVDTQDAIEHHIRDTDYSVGAHTLNAIVSVRQYLAVTDAEPNVDLTDPPVKQHG